MPLPIRILCVDDHDLIVEGLAARISMERDLEFCGRLSTADDLVATTVRMRPDVVLIDLEMPGCSPMDAMADALRLVPRTCFVVLSAHVRDINIAAALERGAVGYFSKSDPPAAIFAGLRTVTAGRQAFGAVVAERIAANPTNLARPVPMARLSRRELEVLRLIGRGMSRADIARELARATKTIDAHHTSIMRKLDIHDRAELTRYAIREGLVEA
ncbi:MAG: response regulator transcription factor [Phycisphaerales bacterium]